MPRGYIVAKPNVKINEQDILAFVQDKVAAYKRLESVVVIDEIPKNATGKIMRRDIKLKYLKNWWTTIIMHFYTFLKNFVIFIQIKDDYITFYKTIFDLTEKIYITVQLPHPMELLLRLSFLYQTDL